MPRNGIYIYGCIWRNNRRNRWGESRKKEKINNEIERERKREIVCV